MFINNLDYCLARPEVNNSFLNDAVINLLKENISDERIIFEIEYNSSSLLGAVETKKQKVKEIVFDKIDIKNSVFRLRINYVDNKFDLISGKYLSLIEVPITASYIKFGDVIKISDLKSFKVPFDSVANNYATDISQIIGMQAKKYIPVGSMIKIGDLLSPPVIKNNDPVNIIFNSGVIKLKTSGVAMGPGAVGEMIKVKNTTSGAILLGQIINKNTVQVGGDNE